MGGFYTIWSSCTRILSLSCKEPFRFQSNFFFHLSHCCRKRHGQQRKRQESEARNENKHKHKSHKRGTANETNHETKRRNIEWSLRRKRKRRQRRRRERIRNECEEKDIPVKYANVNELICAILRSRKSEGKVFNHANGQAGEETND